MKILFLLHLPPPNYGVTNINKCIFERMINKELQINLVAINTAKKLEQIEKKTINKIITLFSILRGLLCKLCKNKYYLCYFSLTPTGIGFYKDMVLVLLVKLFGIKILYHMHGKGILQNSKSFNKILYRLCFKNSKVILTSFSLFDDVSMYVRKDDVYIIPNAVELRIGNKDFDKVVESRAAKGKINLLFLSNMTRSKGVFYVLKAAKILKDKNYDFKLYFAGGWFDIIPKEFTDEVNALDLNEYISYLGFLEGEAKDDIFKKADVFVYPTFNDTFPLVLLEAAQFGLPIISTYEGAIPDIIDDNITGFLIPKKDYQTLAEKIDVLFNNKNLRLEMGKAARSKFLQEYTFDKLENRILDIFSKLAYLKK